MLIKFENKLLSFGLLLMSCHLMVRTAVIKQLNNSVISQQQQEVVPLAEANVQNNVVVPLMASSNVVNHDHHDHHDNHDHHDPHYRGPSSYPHKEFNNFNQDPGSHSPHPMLRKGDEYPLDQRLPVEDPDYYYNPDNPPARPNSGQHGRKQHPREPRPTKKPKKIYKAIERVYYYPHTDSEPARNKDALTQMKEFIPIPDESHDDDSHDEHEQDDDDDDAGVKRAGVKRAGVTRKDYGQMNENPPRGDHEEPEEVYATDNTGAQRSIANDAKEFGKEAVDEAKSFEKFLDNLRHFADKSEKEYSSPTEELDSDDEPNRGLRGLQDSEEDNSKPLRYSDSMAAHTADDRAREYEKISNYGPPDEYDSEKNSYHNQRDQIGREQRGGHRYHKDRRRPRKSNALPDEEYERRNKEVSGLIDSEPEERDYLSNFDVVKQMKNSEQKYNTGIDPIYSSARDFDEVTRLEKMIENVALLNKKKENTASNTHDRNEGQGGEGSESKTAIKIEKKGGDKKQKS